MISAILLEYQSMKIAAREGRYICMQTSQPSSFRSLLGGSEGSILDVFGKGEYEFDEYQIKLYVSRGQDQGFVIRYGKKLIDLKQERNINDVVTGIYPFWKNPEGDSAAPGFVGWIHCRNSPKKAMRSSYNLSAKICEYS